MKRQLAAVQQRKANKLTQEELFASLAEYQLDPRKINQLGSSSHMQEKLKNSNEDEEDNTGAEGCEASTSTSQPELEAPSCVISVEEDKQKEAMSNTDEKNNSGSSYTENEPSGSAENAAPKVQIPPKVGFICQCFYI
ncbi:unnamed protein product [Strongylus vulgaris]|uniref:Uncharacterized protein n=1 Tax=Strongylus vulgaris TaxID=40348 RepID=A0A3P7M2N4_STRVU|nr:unnamed protein product [Strongylus vulgaris]